MDINFYYIYNKYNTIMLKIENQKLSTVPPKSSLDAQNSKPIGFTLLSIRVKGVKPLSFRGYKPYRKQCKGLRKAM